MDDPLWEVLLQTYHFSVEQVLIPLLVDDPLWDYGELSNVLDALGLNPSFSG